MALDKIDAAFITGVTIPSDLSEVSGEITEDMQDYAEGLDNLIINGDFDIWDEYGVGVREVLHPEYCADLMQYSNASTAVHNSSGSIDVPTLAESGHKSTYSLLLDCTTNSDGDDVNPATDAIASGNLLILTNYIEGYDYTRIAGGYATLSFWVKATRNTTGSERYCVGFRNAGNDRSYVAEYTVNSSEVWEKKEITVNFNETGGTWDYINGRGIRVSFCLMAGTTFQGSGEVWQTGNYFATSGQVNACDSTLNKFRISQIMFNKGTVAAPFVRAGGSIARERELHDRYYETSYLTGTAVGTAVGTGTERIYLSNHANSAHTINVTTNYARKRATPTVRVYDISGNVGQCTMTSGNVAASVNAAANSVTVQGVGGISSIRDLRYHWESDARL